MKKVLSIVTVATALFFVSCKKETVNPPGVDQPAVSKKLISTNVNGYNNTISYNADGTPSKILRSGIQATYQFTFTYSPGKVNYESYNLTNNKKDEVGEIILINGKVSGFTWTYFDAFGNPINTFNEVFTYNAKGLLSKREYGNNAYNTYTYDNNDNLVETIYYNGPGQPDSKAIYTYTNKKDLFPSFGYFDSYVMGFFLPAKSKYLPATQQNINLVTNTVTYEGNFTYDLDSDGYVLKAYWNSLLPASQNYSWINTFQ